MTQARSDLLDLSNAFLAHIAGFWNSILSPPERDFLFDLMVRSIGLHIGNTRAGNVGVVHREDMNLVEVLFLLGLATWADPESAKISTTYVSVCLTELGKRFVEFHRPGGCLSG